MSTYRNLIAETVSLVSYWRLGDTGIASRNLLVNPDLNDDDASGVPDSWTLAAGGGTLSEQAFDAGEQAFGFAYLASGAQAASLSPAATQATTAGSAWTASIEGRASLLESGSAQWRVGVRWSDGTTTWSAWQTTLEEWARVVVSGTAPAGATSANLVAETGGTSGKATYAFRDAQLETGSTDSGYVHDPLLLAADDGPNDLAGTVKANPAFGVASLLDSDPFDLAARFDGVEDAIEVPDNALLSPQAGAAGKMSLECWMSFAANPASQATIVGKGLGSQYEYAIAMTTTGAIEFNVWTTAGDGIGYVASGALSLNAPHHLVGTYDKAANSIRLYIDGAQVASGTLSGTSANGTAPFTIGKRGDGQFFSGVVDEVALYSAALTAGIVTQHYKAGRGHAARVVQGLLVTAPFSAKVTQGLKVVARASVVQGLLVTETKGSFRGVLTTADRDALAPKYTGDRVIVAESQSEEYWTGSAWVGGEHVVAREGDEPSPFISPSRGAWRVELNGKGQDGTFWPLQYWDGSDANRKVALAENGNVTIKGSLSAGSIDIPAAGSAGFHVATTGEVTVGVLTQKRIVLDHANRRIVYYGEAPYNAEGIMALGDAEVLYMEALPDEGGYSSRFSAKAQTGTSRFVMEGVAGFALEWRNTLSESLSPRIVHGPGNVLTLSNDAGTAYLVGDLRKAAGNAYGALGTVQTWTAAQTWTDLGTFERGAGLFPLAVQTTGNSVAPWAVRADGRVEWGSGSATRDLNLERTTIAGTPFLATGNATPVWLRGAAEGDLTAVSGLSTDTQQRWKLYATGKQEHGPGGVTVPDVAVLRSAVGRMRIAAAGAGAGELAVDAGLGVWGVTPPTTRQTYTATNVTADRSFDANATTLAELADVVGTIIADIRVAGIWA